MAMSVSKRDDVRAPRGKTSRWIRVRVLLALATCTLGMTIVSVVVLLIHGITLGHARRFHAEFVSKHCGRIALKLCGIRLRIKGRPVELAQQSVLISNHTSSLDMIAIIALGLPRTRYFLSGFLRKIPILAVMGQAIGVFWTCSQADTKRRRELFRDACDELGRTGESVFLTPEGQHIGVFNRGAFHLAIALNAPIIPLYIDIPSDVDPGPWLENKELDLRPGTMQIEFKAPIDTTGWTIETVDEHRLSVRRQYACWTEQSRGYLPEQYGEPSQVS